MRQLINSNKLEFVMSNCTKNENWILAQQKTRDYAKKEKQLRIDAYNLSPTKCATCDATFSYEKRKNKFCNHSCAASFNNIGVVRNFNESNNLVSKCKNCCSKLIFNGKHKNVFCNAKCCNEYKINTNIQLWLDSPEKYNILPQYVRKHLLSKANNQCCLCGWGELNPHSNTYPLIIDHIDGNSQNNIPQNLRVICPNCDSLTATYKALNKGNGRHYRRQRYAEGKSW